MSRMTAHRFLALDGMRGVAALVVLILHSFSAGDAWLFPSGGFAVDLFFIISGFVIAYAYEARLKGGLEPSRFIAARLIRLYPLILAGAVLGFLGFIKAYDRSTLAAAFLTGILLIPTPLSPQSEGNMAIPINPPAWSLSLEVFVNVLFVLIVKHLTDRVLVAIVTASALILCYLFATSDGATFGSKWSDFAGGLPRVTFGFFAGVGIFRLWQRQALPRPAVPLSLAIVVLLVCFQIPRQPNLNIVSDALVILVVFPLVVALGVNITLSPRASAVCAVLGDLSYPVYILQGGIVPHFKELPTKFGLYGPSATVMIVSAVVIYIVLCWIALKIYDEPVRRYLTKRLRSGRKADAVGA